MNQNEIEIRTKLRDDFVHYAFNCLKIRTKPGDLKPFALNKAQLFVHEKIERQKLETGRIRAIILKGRQQGISTLIEGRFYWKVTHNKGLQAFILTHLDDATRNLFKMAKRYHENCPSAFRPSIKSSNANELIFGAIDSGYALGTAGNKSVGRSSTIQLFHGSEVALWDNASEHAAGIFQAIPKSPGTEVFLESTARGVSNYFHEQWQLAESGQSAFIPLFVPWYWQDEYKSTDNLNFVLDDDENDLVDLYGLSRAQLCWRREKILELSTGGIDGSKLFKQEYPCTPIEAFLITGEDTYIAPNIVMAARKCNATSSGQVIVGVDPARFGDDRTSIIRRCGRVAFGLQSYTKKDTMEVAGLVNKIIIEEQPFKVCIDVGGLGAGVYDRLKELGHEDVIVSVNSGNTPLDADRYYNKRAEMWGLMREWLLDYPCQVPDSDSLHSDLCGIKYKFDSKTRLQIEKKEDMKKRGIRSPDEADCLALTFAIPSSMFNVNKKIKDSEKARTIMSNFTTIQNLRSLRKR